MYRHVKRALAVAAMVIVVAALGATVAGCSNDPTAMTKKPQGGGQMRYFGGPKSPMWYGPS